MPVFAVIPLATDATPLNEAVVDAFADSSRFKLANGGGWLVVFDGTSKAVCDHIGITGQPEGESSKTGSALVIPFSSYYGRGSSDMWEWLALKIAS